jgi:hypothetical protein
VGGAGTALWTEISTGSVNTAASGDITITTSGKNNLVLTKTAGSSSSQMGITLNVVGGGSFVSVT